MRRDPFLWAALLVIAVPLALSGARWIDVAASAWWAIHGAEVVLLAIAFAAMLASRRDPRDGEPRWFWRLLTLTCGLWFAGAVLQQFAPTKLLAKAVHLGSYLAMIAAADLRPHLPAGWTRTGIGFRYEMAASFVLVGGIIAYFLVTMPGGLSPDGSAIVPRLVFLALDLAIALRFVPLAGQAPTGPWRTVYAGVALSCFAAAAAESLNLYQRLSGTTFAFGTPLDALWWMPMLALVVARRAHHHRVAASGEGVPAGTAADDEPRTGAYEIMLLYGFSFTAMHLALEAAGQLDRAAEVARAGVTLATLLAFSLLAVLKHRALERRTRALRSEIRVLVTNEQVLQAQKMEAVGRLAGGLAHDFNNLLMVIGARAELLADAMSPDDPRRREVASITEAVGRGAALTRQLLAFNRRQSAAPDAVDVGDVVREAEGLLRRLVGEHVSLSTRIEPGAPPIDVESSQLFQVLLNLVANAGEAMPQGGALEIASFRAEVPAAGNGYLPPCPGGTFTALEVRDTGVGIAPEILDRVFEPFFTSKVGGTGLGLAVVYAIVTQSGGHVRVRSERGRGTTITAIFPPSSAEVPGRRGEAPGEAPAASPGPLVLLVEDQAEVRATVRQMLVRLGHRVHDVASGEEAIAAVSRGGERPGVLLTDVVMPGMRGPEVAARIRALCGDLHVVYMSGFVEELSDAQIELDGEAGFLPKPFTVSELGACLRRPVAHV